MTIFRRRRLLSHVVLPGVVGAVRWVAGKVRPPRPAEPLPDPFAGLPAAMGIEATQRTAWRAAAEAAGLTEIAESEPDEGAEASVWVFLEGRSGTLTVRLDRPQASLPASTCIDISGLGHSFNGLRVRPSWGVASAEWGGQADGIQLGVPAFDSAFVVDGHLELAIALLDPPTRRLMMELFHPGLVPAGKGRHLWSGSVAANRLRVELRFPLVMSAEERAESLIETLRMVLDLAHRLEMPADLLERVARNLASEPEAGARLRGVRFLARGARGHEAATKALRAAMEDSSEDVRLEAALACGAEGYPALKALAASVTASDATRLRAIRALGAALTVAELTVLLARELEVEREGVVAVTLAESMGRYGREGWQGSAAAEELLTSVLSDANPPLALAAAGALAKLGTVAAVPALREAESRGSRDLSRAARQAIAEIQARLVGAEAGQLTVAGGEAGALTLTEEGEAGRVSLVGEEEKTDE